MYEFNLQTAKSGEKEAVRINVYKDFKVIFSECLN
jgi:hypothetical protein